MFIRLGKDWNEAVTPMKIAQEYLIQYCGLKKDSDFVLTVVHEENEGDVFWKWFKLQVS